MNREFYLKNYIAFKKKYLILKEKMGGRKGLVLGYQDLSLHFVSPGMISDNAISDEFYAEYKDITVISPANIEEHRNDVESKRMLFRVHGERYFAELENFDPSKPTHDGTYQRRGVYCYECDKLNEGRFESFGHFLEVNPHCQYCKTELRSDNIFAYMGRDTPITPFTHQAILDQMVVIRFLIEQLISEKCKYAMANLQPGNHHMGIRPMGGYGIINPEIIAALHAQSAGFEKVLILDYDFHRGNGGYEILKTGDFPNIYYVDVFAFGKDLFPFNAITAGLSKQEVESFDPDPPESTKQFFPFPLRTTLDEEERKYAPCKLLDSDHYFPQEPKGASQEQLEDIEEIKLERDALLQIIESKEFCIDHTKYLKLFHESVLPVIREVKPNLIYILNSYDAHIEDKLDGLAIVDRTYIEMIKELKKLNIPLFFNGMSGYAANVAERLTRKTIEELNS